MTVYQAAKAVDCSDLADKEGLVGRMMMGGRGKWCCPFHDDSDPSMVTYPGEVNNPSHFYCFSCGAHGDATSLYAKLHHCAPLDAARALCKQWGLAYDEPPRGVKVAHVTAEKDTDPRLAVVLAICSEWQKYRVKWFEEQLAHSQRLLAAGCDSPSWRRDIEEHWCSYYEQQLKKCRDMTEMEVLYDIRKEFEALGVNPYRRLRVAGVAT